MNQNVYYVVLLKPVACNNVYCCLLERNQPVTEISVSHLHGLSLSHFTSNDKFFRLKAMPANCEELL